MENYLINQNTLYLMEKDDNTIIKENNNEILVYDKILKVLDNNCKFYFSSLKGRIDSSSYLLKIQYKCPIIVSEEKEIIFFSLKINKKCMWINYQNLDNVSYSKKNVEIWFKNGTKIDLNISKNIVLNQILKSSRLESILKSKKR